jgi:tripeptide aminopeptidase
MTVLDRFLKYVRFDTMAGEEKNNTCSDEKMLALSQELMTELTALHPDEITINGFGVVDAKFKGDSGKPGIALLAHIDTSPQASDKNVQARVLDYKGGVIPLNDKMALDPKEFASLARAVGHRVVVTDGTTLLGGDDKAGIAIIMTALTEILEGKKKHRPLEIIFTTDEEIGADAKHISMERVTSKYGYTIDGGPDGYVSTETFTAYALEVDVSGKSIHPGSAKDKLVNAGNVLIHFQNALPEFLRPEDTADLEPFFHLCSFKGSEDSAHADYIIRSFSETEIQQLIDLAKLTARRINDKLGYPAITLTFKEQYHNMKTVLDKHPEILGEIDATFKKVGIPYIYFPVRGGTTGSQLSLMGVPCPNLGTGDYNCHGKYEYVDVNEMENMVAIVSELMK